MMDIELFMEMTRCATWHRAKAELESITEYYYSGNNIDKYNEFHVVHDKIQNFIKEMDDHFS
jgi:hypothetical protein